MMHVDAGTLEASRDYRRIERAIRYLDENASRQPGLEEVASEIGLSPFHTQRLFTRFAGISPKRFLGLLTVGHAKALLQDGQSVLDATYEVGLSGPSRLHDLFISYEAMTPGEYKRQGADLEIRYGICPTPFDEALVLTTERGIAGLSFIQGDPAAVLERAREEWPQSRFVADPKAARHAIAPLFDRHADAAPRLLLKGTNFQIKVWSAMLSVPPGHLISYGDLAQSIGRPGAAQAVGRALSANPLGFIVPCHRVIRATGALGDYRWGKARRRAILAWEAAGADAA
jgi:AraC family transcriptional regulator, regulatory protein of adaptative response / methylated-DNA-[protein]-cysteine methyltransferase